VQDPNSSWTDGGGNRWINSNNNSTNSATVFTGLPEEEASGDFSQNVTFSSTSNTTFNAAVGIGVNSSATPAGSVVPFGISIAGGGFTGGGGGLARARYVLAPALGINTFFALQNPAFNGGSSDTIIYFGSVQMMLTVSYRG
jgi:hypothetical protein